MANVRTEELYLTYLRLAQDRKVPMDFFDRPDDLRCERDNSFSDTIAVLPGSTSGLGAGIGMMLALKGARVLFNYHTPDNEKYAAYLLKTLERAGVDMDQVGMFLGDVNNQHNRKQMLSRTRDEFGPITFIAYFPAYGARKKDDPLVDLTNCESLVHLALEATEGGCISPDGCKYLEITSEAAMSFDGNSISDHPSTKKFGDQYIEVARSKQKGHRKLYDQLPHLEELGMRVHTLVVPIVLPTKPMIALQRLSQGFYNILVAKYGQTTRETVARTSLGLISNHSLPSGYIHQIPRD